MASDLFSDHVMDDTSRSLHSIWERSDLVMVKRLSRNDRSWADDPDKHQGGFYIPAEQRKSGFFPQLHPRTDKPHIYRAEIRTHWLTSRETRSSRLIHYSNKGSEAHITRVPKGHFRGLTPASFIVLGRDRENSAIFHCMTIDAVDELASELEGTLGLKPDFRCGVFNALEVVQKEQDEIEELLAMLEQLLDLAPDGNWSDQFPIPTGRRIADEARASIQSIYSLDTLDVRQLEAPGDLLNELIKEVEFSIFRRHERLYRLAAVIQSMADEIRAPTRSNLLRSLIREFDTIYEIMKGARQARTSRVGNSLEYHLQAMLHDSGIPFSAQAIIGTTRRPDFLLPDIRYYGTKEENLRYKVLVLSAKTTLRERWRQPFHESDDCPIYLATLDAGISEKVLDSFSENGMYAVVPESSALLIEEADLHEKTSERRKDTNLRPEVRTFHQFFHQDIQSDRMPTWTQLLSS